MKTLNLKNLLRIDLLLFTLALSLSACTKKLDSTSSDGSSGSTGVTVKVTSPTADSTNISSFPLSGDCIVNDSVSVATTNISKTVACSVGGTWNTTLNVAGLADGTYTVTVTSQTNNTISATVSFTKTTAATCVGGPTVFTTNMNARYVIGQANMISNSANRGGSAAANTLNGPVGITVSNGKLYIADAGNNRVLVYNTVPTSNGTSADAVIGQSSFTTTTSGLSATAFSGIQQIASDGTYLAVAEWGNARVSFWPLSNPTSASYVWGQPNATSNTVNNGGRSATSMGNAAGLSYYGGKFFVGDVSNNRVLVFDSSSISTNQAAINVVGQTDFTTSGSSGSGLTGFGSPYSVSSDGTHLAIMDNNSQRVMLYNSIPSTNGASADVTWGGFGITSTGLNNPVGVFVGSGKMFIADRNSDRILVFNSIPTSASTPADAALGQANFTGADHNQCNCSTAAANTIWGVHHLYYDGCRLYVTDKQNHRVLVY